jgi:hypothetical protein
MSKQVVTGLGTVRVGRFIGRLGVVSLPAVEAGLDLGQRVVRRHVAKLGAAGWLGRAYERSTNRSTPHPFARRQPKSRPATCAGIERWRRSPKQPQLPQSASGSTARSLAWTSRSPDVDGAADAEVLYAFRMTSQGLLKAGKATGAPRLLLLRRKAAAVGACDSWPRRRSASGL